MAQLFGTRNPAWKGGKVELTCPKCACKFHVFASRVGMRVYCSRRCYAESQEIPVTRGTRKHPKYYRRETEKRLGRKLTFNEIVHHVDTNCENDSPENHEIMPRAIHTSMHAKERHEMRRQRDGL